MASRISLVAMNASETVKTAVGIIILSILGFAVLRVHGAHSIREQLMIIAIRLYAVMNFFFLYGMVGLSGCVPINDNDQPKWQYFAHAYRGVALLIVAGLIASIILLYRRKVGLAFVCVAIPFVLFVTALGVQSRLAPPVDCSSQIL